MKSELKPHLFRFSKSFISQVSEYCSRGFMDPQGLKQTDSILQVYTTQLFSSFSQGHRKRKRVFSFFPFLNCQVATMDNNLSLIHTYGWMYTNRFSPPWPSPSNCDHQKRFICSHFVRRWFKKKKRNWKAMSVSMNNAILCVFFFPPVNVFQRDMYWALKK